MNKFRKFAKFAKSHAIATFVVSTAFLAAILCGARLLRARGIAEPTRSRVEVASVSDALEQRDSLVEINCIAAVARK